MEDQSVMLYISKQKSRITAAVVLGLSLAYFIVLTAPNITWVNVDADAPNYVIAAEEIRLSHPSPGSPLYNLVNIGWIRLLPGSNTFWEISLLSAIAASLVSLTLYLLTKNVLAPLLWLASGVVVSQSTIVESYALVCLFSVIGYWLYVSDKRTSSYLILGLGVMVHHLAVILIIVFLIRDLWLKKSKLPFLAILVSLPLLAYIPLVNREPFIWTAGDSLRDYYRYFFSQGGLLGGLAILPTQDLQRRLLDFSLVVGGSLAVVVPLLYYSVKRNREPLLLALCIIPLVYYFTNLAPQTYTYVILSIPFAAILVTKVSTSALPKFLPQLTMLVLITTMGLNIQWYDIGRTLDKDMHALEFYDILKEAPFDNSAVWSESRGWEKHTIELFNFRNKTLIDTVNIRKPFPRDLRASLEEKETLWRTVVFDNKTHGVFFVQTTVEEILEGIDEFRGPRGH